MLGGEGTDGGSGGGLGFDAGREGVGDGEAIFAEEDDVFVADGDGADVEGGQRETQLREFDEADECGGGHAVCIADIGESLIEIGHRAGGGDAAVDGQTAFVAGDVGFGDEATDADFDGGAAGRLGLGVVVEGVDGVFEEAAIHLVTDGGDVAALFGAEDVACAADFEIAHGDFETGAEHGVLLEGFQSFLGGFFEGAVDG